MKSEQVVLSAIVGFALLCLLGLWWLKAETPAPPAEAPAPVERAAPAPAPAPRPPSGPAPAAPAARPKSEPLTPPRMPTLGEQESAPRMTPMRPDWDVKRLHFAHDAPTALEAVRPLVGECFRDNDHQRKPGDRVVLRFGVAQGGHLEGTEVVSSTVQDPYLHACLEDALHDATTTQIGSRGPTSYVFTYQADGGTTAAPAP